MSDSSEGPWSNNPNAPQIPPDLHVAEKANFVGNFIGAMLYGIIIVLFFQCMRAFFSPADRAKTDVRWGLVAHTVIMFSSTTVYTAMNLHIGSVSSIDKREFTGDDVLFPGPLGYQLFINSNVIIITPDILILLNGWLADGLLLYRCYVLYAMNYWIIAFPCMMYLATWASGLAIIYYQAARPWYTINDSAIPDFGYPFYSISFALNAILTLMIITRLVLHRRNIQEAMGTAAGAFGLHRAIITMLVESAAIYATTYILFIGTWGSSSPAQFIFLPTLAQIQVIVPFLIILRVANHRALTSEAVVSGNLGSIHFRSEGKSTVVTEMSEMSPYGDAGSSTDIRAEASGSSGAGAETVIEEVPL